MGEAVAATGERIERQGVCSSQFRIALAEVVQGIFQCLQQTATSLWQKALLPMLRTRQHEEGLVSYSLGL